jgi:type IV secretion system protein VirD4
LTEELTPKGDRHRVLMLLDEFPALGRLDFFESALAFMAGYGLKAFLIAQSLNQIEKAYGQHNSILDNCHVRVTFATNDDHTAKRVSESLGTTTEQRAMKNYAGHRLSPWLGHLMISRSETSRPLLTQGEILQLPEHQEIVLMSGVAPILAEKARYYADPQFQMRLLPAPDPLALRPKRPPDDDWHGPAPANGPKPNPGPPAKADPANAGVRREPELPLHVDIAPPKRAATKEFDFGDSAAADDDAVRAEKLRARMQGAARQASLDPGDGITL